jgi:arginase
MIDFEVIGVPFDGYGRAGNQARAAGALRAAGLVAVLGDGGRPGRR